jgi:hypothetical protein
MDYQSVQNKVSATLISPGRNDVKYQSPQTDNTDDSYSSQGLSFIASFGCLVVTLNKRKIANFIGYN